MSTTEATWVDVVNHSVLGVSGGYALGYSHGYSRGYHEAQLDAHRNEVNRQISRAGVQNISVEVARAKADRREPRLYDGRRSA